MIGVITKESEKEIVKEFFELFKTPWEFYQDNHSYDVILTTGENIEEINAKLIIIYKNEKNRFDYENRIEINLINSQKDNRILEYDGSYFPIYGKIMTFGVTEKSLIRVKGTTEAVGIEIKLKDKKILRIGFDLFQEINFLLSSGQPAEHAYIPTLEMHISMLRNWILNSNIALIEIPPIPAGYAFTACLTHDVDFVGIRNHKFDHTIFGFLYRALIRSLINFLKGKTSGKKLWRNWKAVISLPFVYIGIAKDFMVQFDRYIDLDKAYGSTFFIMPFKNHEGYKSQKQTSKHRASKYDITDIIQEINKLTSSGFEIGLHGIDAWRDPVRGREELERISDITGQTEIGVRIHWLYYEDKSPKVLEHAGFMYDSTYGYNETVGFKAGTGQVFCFPGVEGISELPLIIMDTALFYPSHLDLTETEAQILIRKIIERIAGYGGALTINWHHRSVGPERFWDDSYTALLKELEKSNVWFGTAQQVVSWFKKRRSILFDDARDEEKRFRLKYEHKDDSDIPNMVLRIHDPAAGSFKDIVLSDDQIINIPLTVAAGSIN